MKLHQSDVDIGSLDSIAALEGLLFASFHILLKVNFFFHYFIIRIQARVYEVGNLIPIESHFSTPVELRKYIYIYILKIYPHIEELRKLYIWLNIGIIFLKIQLKHFHRTLSTILYIKHHRDRRDKLRQYVILRYGVYQPITI